MTVAGVCTSLGLGTMQIATGLQRVGWVDPEKEDLMNVYIITIWVITGFATVSVVSGLKVGIKILSLAGFCLGCLILFLCFVMEKSYYLLNLVVQTTGVYLQWSIFQVPFWTDAFASLTPGEGRAVDGKSAESWWIGAWTVFYMAWWVSWACFVGIFIARITKNRSIRSVVCGVFLAPTLYALLWFPIMGGIGLRQQRQALELKQLGAEYFQDEAHYMASGSSFCYDVPQSDVYVGDELVFSNTLPGITPVCEFDSSNAPAAWFNVMDSFTYPDTGIDGNFPGFGQFMSGLSIFALGVYFVTSSDSGSLVVDTLASNGSEEHHYLQRVFWAFTEGAVATGLIVAGGSDALGALQAASIVFGLPFNFFIFIMCWSVYQMCVTLEREGQDQSHDAKMILPKKNWEMPLVGGVFNVLEWLCAFGRIHPSLKASGIDLPSIEDVGDFVKSALVPFVTLYSIYTAMDTKGQHATVNKLLTAIYAAFHLGWIVLFSFGTYNYGFVAFAWSMFFINACILTSVRSHVRGKFGLQGNIVGDFTAGSFLYPQALVQMETQIAKEKDIGFSDEDSTGKNA